MSYKLTVIIPTYNAEDTLLESINSLQNQTFGFENIEVILVDDNSRDSTKDILNNLSKKYENIKSIFLENNSGSASTPRNKGIKASTTEYIMFLDSDDRYDEKMCETMYKSITNNSVDCVICKYEYVTNNNTIKIKSFLDKYNKKQIFNSIKDNPEVMSLGVPSMIWNKIFRANIIKNNNLKFLEGCYYEDVEFNMNYYLNSNKILILNSYYGYKYNRVEENNSSSCQEFSQKMLIKQLKGFLKIMESLEKQPINYEYMKNEIIIDMTKIYLYSTSDKNCEKKFLKIMKPYYKDYSLTTRVHTAGLVFNIGINIFIKLFAISDKIAMFTHKLLKK